MIQQFLAFSAEMTAFTEFDLLGTGLANDYLAAVVKVVGPDLVAELLAAYDSLAGTSGDDRTAGLRKKILGDEKLGPIARNIIKIWYSGLWFELPKTWTDNYGALENNILFAVSGPAYTEALVYKAIGANPPGAKGPGYGSWSLKPNIPPVPVIPAPQPVS